ncbi:hypothetical protein ATK17_2565 [Branchiibius hedensis]|uniref:Lipoprotein LpqN n=1 Tax=Branchiibius hedensis TaxID=672460 RepID=A0A2Y8ZTJ9_9MICO|nr:hypothetical protein [Branchiibius hedensis]PWJ26403.1 hypothetical protein ATK17_2565 [Branchiibius hedensis]SSA35215.1 hypothetical protein SAMN04489750_2565 [Branchiibius hedensis]
MNSSLVTAAVTVLVACSLAACSSSSPGSTSQTANSLRPSDSAPATYTPVATPPLNYRTLTGKGFTLRVPAAWTDNEVPATAKGGTPGVAAREQGRDPSLPVGVAVVVDNQPASDALAQSEVLATTKVSTGQAKDVTRSTVKWPGTTSAVLVTWTETPQGTSDPYRIEQLFAQVSPDLILNVVGKAPAAEFGAAGIERIMRTFTVQS